MIFRGIEVILDVAHNPAAAGVLAASLAQFEANNVAVASVLDDKDWSGIVSAISPVIDQWNIAEISDSPRATKGQSLLELLYNAGQSGSLHQSVEEAFLNAVAACSPADRIIVFGSFHTVAAVLNLILAEVSSD
jgi:dihydrofolate synthase/folylpolyglutamate synthase